MAIVSSYGQLTAVATPAATLSSVTTSGPFYDGYRRTYAQIYQTQPAVRTVVDFFARNIAQLGVHVFQVQGEVDRVRLRQHPLAQAVQRPNPATTRYRLIESAVQDVGIYANAFWLKVRARDRLGLVRLPALEVSVRGSLIPTGYEWQPTGGRAQAFAPSEIVHFRLFDPTNPAMGLPPLETLRRVLAEEAAAGQYREQFWRNAGRFETVITRPKEAPNWTPAQRDQFRTQWQEFAGSGAKAGRSPVLEDGMDVKPVAFNAKDSQYVESLKLSREVVAAAYHVPLPMVGILDHATFSNIREQHKQLYQDCLGPWLVMLEEELELQLLPEFEDVTRDEFYVEFNIAEKMKGSFEEQADSLQRAIGRPWMTPNEGRARLNLPRDPDPESDRIATVAPGQAAAAPAPATARNALALQATLARFFARQRARVEKADASEQLEACAAPRWARELAQDLAPALGPAANQAAQDINRQTVALLGRGEAPWTDGRLEALVAWLLKD